MVAVTASGEQLGHGMFLSAEQTKRLAMMERGERQQVIELIAAHLRDASRRTKPDTDRIATPRDWYRQPAEYWV